VLFSALNMQQLDWPVLLWWDSKKWCFSGAAAAFLTAARM
jgi:hypothetical protein